MAERYMCSVVMRDTVVPLRVRRHRRLTQHSLPGGLLGSTWAGLAPADSASFCWRLPSFDHLVGPQQERFRDSEPKSLRGLQINDQLISLDGL